MLKGIINIVIQGISEVHGRYAHIYILCVHLKLNLCHKCTYAYMYICVFTYLPLELHVYLVIAFILILSMYMNRTYRTNVST